MKLPPMREPGQVVTAAYLGKGSLRYGALDREITGRDGAFFNNRPLYGPANAGGVTLAGDRPFIRLIAKPYVHGSFAAAILRGAGGRWFHEYEAVETRYRCGRMTWRMTDPCLPGVEVTLVIAPLADGAGFAAHLSARGLLQGDRLAWTLGGAVRDEDPRTRWDPVNRGNPQVLRTDGGIKPELLIGPMPEWSRGNEVGIGGGGFRLAASPGAAAAVGRSDRGGTRALADASAGATPAGLAASVAGSLPVACEVIALGAGEDAVFWSVGVEGTLTRELAPRGDFERALARLESVERIRSATPDPFLDAAVAAVCHPIDGNCEKDPAIFRHGCMSFSIRFIGWRVINGATVLGWHDRVRENAAHYVALQEKEAGTRTEPWPDPGLRLCQEGLPSRFYGRGRITPDQSIYNTQTQFFDQTIRDWRWTADPALETILRPALELHLEWARECFDPDDDGLYESYNNTLPTDSIWYNGGGGVEESAYAFYGHRAAADLARRAGDHAAEARHGARADKIARALRDVLWLKDRGHFGVYVEQGGHRRVQAESWTCSQFLPVDAGIVTPDEALQSLFFTEWALERIRLPFGGVLCQQSNWVPSKWSVRDMFSGDLCHLALAYFQTGLAEEGWDLLRGTLLEGCYASAVPGGFSHIGAGTDFGDSAHMFARVVAEGLFGYDPDYPNGVVRIHPAFPAEWPSASLKTPDFSLEYRRDGDTERYVLELSRDAAVAFRVPVRAAAVARVTWAGREVAWAAEPGFGFTWIAVAIPRFGPAEGRAELAVALTGRVPAAPAQFVEGEAGTAVRLEVGEGGVLRDFHGAIADPVVSGGFLTGRLARKPGHHVALVTGKVGDLPRHRIIKLAVRDSAAAAAHAARTPREAPPGSAWTCVDIGGLLNADVREIFRQRYLSPRPRTCSVRLGVDGYSAWTFPHWREEPPDIRLDALDGLAAGDGRILTPQGVPFARPGPGRNIGFTSHWDNWPRSVTVPVGRTATTAWLLVCGSTFPIQMGIANAVLRFDYADGRVETLDLVPPRNFWSLCTWGGLDYSYETDAFCLPSPPPPMVQLGANCRAMVLSWKLLPGAELAAVTLEALSQDVVIGLMGLSLMDAPR